MKTKVIKNDKQETYELHFRFGNGGWNFRACGWLDEVRQIRDAAGATGAIYRIVKVTTTVRMEVVE